MNTPMIQSKSTFENGMNVHLMSFALPKNIIKDNEEIRVSITTVPEEQKQSFSLAAKNMVNVNHVFSINITNETKKIIIVFRKKTFFSDNPIIASSIIHLIDLVDIPNQRMTNGMMMSDVKYYNIYYPLKNQRMEENKDNIQRKVLGQMEIQLSLLPSYLIQEKNHQTKNKNLSKIKINSNFQHKTNEKKGDYAKL